MPPRTVEDGKLAAANALLHMATNLAIVLGPVAAAGSIALIGFDGAFIFDAITYGLGASAVYAVAMHDAPEGEEHTGAWRETVAGIRIVITTRALRKTVLLMSGVYFLYGTALMLEPVYVRDVLERPVSTHPRREMKSVPSREACAARPTSLPDRSACVVRERASRRAAARCCIHPARRLQSPRAASSASSPRGS